jgi:hypothetical protein
MLLSRLLKSILDCKTETRYLLLERLYSVECREISNKREVSLGVGSWFSEPVPYRRIMDL